MLKMKRKNPLIEICPGIARRAVANDPRFQKLAEIKP